jgi:polysaccharide deacetylase family protein (PEP-CTERM system associated)
MSANAKNPLVLFVDLDEWFHCRWATGSSSSRWAGLGDCFRETYHSDKPVGEIVEATRWILDCLKEYRVKVTFAILGEVAEWYPDLVKQITQEGHNIACHGMHHVDATLLTREQFSEDLARARHILEDLSGKQVIGFRAPNLIITDWLPKVLVEQGFAYDSSICPARNPSKFKEHRHAPRTPYRVSLNSLSRRGNSSLIEIPMSVFPLLRMPGGTSISTRILGWGWTRVAIDSALRSGPACYYMHPYEFNPTQGLSKVRLNERLFLFRTGAYMKATLQKMLRTYEGRIVTAEYFISHCFPMKGLAVHS